MSQKLDPNDNLILMTDFKPPFACIYVPISITYLIYMLKMISYHTIIYSFTPTQSLDQMMKISGANTAMDNFNKQEKQD